MIDSSPRRRLSQNADTLLAPGNLPAMPTTAIALRRSRVSPSTCSCLLSSLSPRRGSLARRSALLCSVANRVTSIEVLSRLGEAELADHIDREILQRCTLQDHRHRWLDAEIPRVVLRIRTAIKESIPSSVSGIPVSTAEASE